MYVYIVPLFATTEKHLESATLVTWGDLQPGAWDGRGIKHSYQALGQSLGRTWLGGMMMPGPGKAHVKPV